MTTYYIPIERKALPASDPLRWFILPIDAADPILAMDQASTTVREDMRLKNVAIWAAVRDCPSMGYMQEVRESMDACRYGRAPRAKNNRIPGYV